MLPPATPGHEGIAGHPHDARRSLQNKRKVPLMPIRERVVKVSWGSASNDEMTVGRIHIHLWPVAAIFVIVLIGVWFVAPRFYPPARTVPAAHMTILPSASIPMTRPAPASTATPSPAQVINVPAKPGAPVCVVPVGDVRKNIGTLIVKVPG